MKNHKIKNTFVRAWLLRLAVSIFVITTLFVLTVFCLGRGTQKASRMEGSNGVVVKNENGRFSFYKNGKPIEVKGGVGFTHLEELAACGGNTVTCWDTARLANTLQEAALHNISVIIGLDIPDGADLDFYQNKNNVSKLFNAYGGIVNKYKGHPAVLAYCLGNELTFPFSLTKTAFYRTYESLLGMINHDDPEHPVSTSVINIAKKNILNIQWRLPSLDFLCINTYNRIKVIQKDLSSVSLFWNGPYLVSEWAPNGGWEAENTTWDAPIENTSTKKAEQFYEFYTRYMPLKDPRFLGSLAFYWGNRIEYTNTWYSVFNADETPTEIKEVLYDCWKDTLTHHRSPMVEYMLVDSMGARDNIIFSPGSKHSAGILLQDNKSIDSFRYSWHVLKEDWMSWGKAWNNFKKPEMVSGLMFDSTTRLVDFTAPGREGLYRIFVTVYNSTGYCATANTPIYVVEK